MLGKSRWVKDNKVVSAILHLIEKAERIFSKGFMTFVVREIQLYIGIHQIHSLGTTVNRVYRLCPTPHGIDAEAASIAEHVQHLTAMGISLYKGPILALVDEEARFLALEPVDMELQSVLYGYVIITLTKDEAILLTQGSLKGKGCLALVVNSLQVVAHNSFQGLGNLHATDMHTYAVGLHNGILSVDINDKARQVIALAMNQTVHIIICCACYAYALAHVESRREALLPKFSIYLLTLKGKDTNGDAAYLPMTKGYETALVIQHFDDITLGRFTLDMMHCTREDPWVKTLKTLLFALTKYNKLTHLVLSLYFLYSSFWIFDGMYTLYSFGHPWHSWTLVSFSSLSSKLQGPPP